MNSSRSRSNFFIIFVLLIFAFELDCKDRKTLTMWKPSALMCNPSTLHLFGKFLLQRWFDARTELGINRVINKLNSIANIDVLNFLSLYKASEF